MKLLIRLKEGTFTLADAAAADYLRGKGHHADYMVAFELGEFAFADRLHDCVSCDEVQISAVANQKAGIAKFVDEARCAIGCIEYRLQRVFLKNGPGTIRSAQFFLDITASLFFAHSIQIIIHDDPLPQRFVSGKAQGIV